MKKIIILIAIAFVFFFMYDSYAEEKITVSGGIKLGTDIESYKSFCDLELALNIYFWKCKWSVFGGNRTWFDLSFDDGISGHPFRNIYLCGSRFNLVGFFVEFQHFCNHAVNSGNNNKWWSNYWGEDMTTISIGYTFELPIWESNKNKRGNS